MSGRCLVLLLAFHIPGASAFSADSAIVEKKPSTGPVYSTGTAMTFDVFPGGGHFYTGHYVSGTLVGASKIGLAGTSWFLYSYSVTARRNYRDAVKIRDSSGVSDDTPISGPDGRKRSVSSYRREYDRKRHYFTLSLAANCALWAASWIMVWNYCDDRNSNSVPTFDADAGVGTIGNDKEAMFRFCCTKSF